MFRYEDYADEDQPRRVAELREGLKKNWHKPDSYYGELKWIAMKAGIKPGWAYFRFKEDYEREPTNAERDQKPIVPNEGLIICSQSWMSDWRYKKVCMAYEYAKMTPEEREKRKLEIARDKKFANKAYYELDANRPRLDEL